MSNSDECRAGSIILGDFALFNKAAVLYEQKIQPAVAIAISDVFRNWLEKCGWKGQPDFGARTIWVCPSKWKDENPEPFAKFDFTRRPGTETWSYDIADLCGIGETDWGFQFEVGYSRFGGKNAWAATARNMGGLADEVVQRGLSSVGKLVFFRPIKLHAELLADAWEMEDWSKLLKPLEQALDALLEDQAVFDKIIVTANPKTK